MLVRIQATAYNGKALAEPLAAEFDELGGNIGRGDSNTLILPDPERHVSRTHAAVMFRGGRYVLLDKGSVSAVHINGRELGQGRETAINDGDELTIGGYVLRISMHNDPAAEAQLGKPLPAGRPVNDPLALFSTGGSAANPFADLMPPARQSLMDDPFASASQNAAPANFDPFADFGALAASAGGGPLLPDDLDLGLEPATANQKIDDLFGLGPAASDPFAPGSALADPLRGLPSDTDPLAGFSAAPAANSARPQRNDTPELHGSFRPPQPIPAAPAAKVEPKGEGPWPTEPGMVLSWDEHGAGSGEIKTIIINPSRRAEDTPVRPPAGPAASPVGPAPLPSESSRNIAPDPASLLANPGSQEELLRAFLNGAGVPDLALPGGLAPRTMAMLGEILREATQGTLDLLLARAMIKREVRAEMTMIVARENNPLKFSPNVEAALAHLLAPQARGFMPPVQAMQDAYDDLRSHQFAFMAGMRAALAGVLQRFNPTELEERLTRRSMMDSLLPMNRKARLWDLFGELYGDISKEAEDNFHALFGKEFLRAYEAQIEKLQREDKQDREDKP